MSNESNGELHDRVIRLEEQLKSSREAVRLQATEYERRLQDLNHAHAQAALDRGKYVTVELYTSKMDALARWQNEFDTWRGRVGGIAVGIALASGLITSLVMRFVLK